MRLNRFQLLGLAALVAVIGFVATGCASVATKERAVLSHQAAQTTLERFQDTERRLCNPAAFYAAPRDPVLTCAGPVAESLRLTTEKHQAFSAHMQTAFQLQRRAGVVLLAWKPGSGIPPELTSLEAQAEAALAIARALVESEQQRQFVAIGETLLDEVRSIVAAIRE